jgi:hypothetical protein
MASQCRVQKSQGMVKMDVFRQEPEMGKGVWNIQRTVSLCNIREQRAAKGGKLNQLVPEHCRKKCLT